MKVIKYLRELLAPKEQRLKAELIVIEELKSKKGNGLKVLDGQNIGQQPLSVVLPHLQVVAKSYNLKLNRASDFKLARTILTSWLSKQNVNVYATH